jgi:hypothetical protein
VYHRRFDITGKGRFGQYSTSGCAALAGRAPRPSAAKRSPSSPDDAPNIIDHPVTKRTDCRPHIIANLLDSCLTAKSVVLLSAGHYGNNAGALPQLIARE